jgi:hypothetical protein
MSRGYFIGEVGEQAVRGDTGYYRHSNCPRVMGCNT